MAFSKYDSERSGFEMLDLDEADRVEAKSAQDESESEKEAGD